MGQRAQVAQGGFTLLELLVTILLMALAVGLVGPAVARNTETVRARADVAGFSAVLRHAREKAIVTRQSHSVVVDPAENRLTVTTGEDEVRETRLLPGRVHVQATPPPALTVRFEPYGTSNGGDFRVTSGAVSYRVTVDATTGRVRSQRL
jgi:prepilin-type N-terminal cleavage/methylation domain-containing protein